MRISREAFPGNVIDECEHRLGEFLHGFLCWHIVNMPAIFQEKELRPLRECPGHVLNGQTVHIDLDIFLDGIFGDSAGFLSGFEIDHHVPAIRSLLNAINETVQRVAGKRKRELMFYTGYGINICRMPCKVGIEDRMCGNKGFGLLKFGLVHV